MLADHRVLEHGHVREQVHVLERARDAELHLVRSQTPRCSRRATARRRRRAGTGPVITLNTVVFPAPFGPITETISPSRTSNEAVERAEAAEPLRDPVDLEQSLGARPGTTVAHVVASAVGPRSRQALVVTARPLVLFAVLVVQLAAATHVGHQALRPQQHHGHERGAVGQQPVLLELAQQARAARPARASR